MPRSVSLALFLLACACDGQPTLRCGAAPSCAEAPRPDAGSPTLDDASTVEASDAEAPIARADAGGWSLEPPGSPPPEPGCDASSGECDAWAAELVRLLDAARSCETSLAIDDAAERVAQRQADYQASIDRLTGASPDGDLFDQLRADGVTFSDAGAMFSTTREGPSDVVARWQANPNTAPLVARCWTHVGAAFSTSASGASYATVLFVSR